MKRSLATPSRINLQKQVISSGLTWFLFMVLALFSPSMLFAQFPLLGDVDGNGLLEGEDANLITAAIATGSLDPFSDLDANGTVDNVDLDHFFDSYSAGSGVPLSIALVDINFDMVNTVLDYQILLSNLSVMTTDFTAGNLKIDGVINADDLALYLSRGGVVPEPSALIQTLLLTLTLTVGRNRRQTRKF
jgi:hypothetical protein